MGSGRRSLYPPCKFFAKHPKLLDMRCLRVTCYQNSSSRYCAECYYKITEPNDCKLATFHGLLAGPIREINCYQCGIDLIINQRAIDCNSCPSVYFVITRSLRILGFDPDSIHGLLFDMIAKEVLRIILTRDVDV